MKNKSISQKKELKTGSKDKISNSEDVKNNPDNHIDQDFPGFPHSPSSEKMINPTSNQEKKVAAVDKKDGEKIIDPQTKKKNLLNPKKSGEENSDGSANAFDATETVRE